MSGVLERMMEFKDYMDESAAHAATWLYEHRQHVQQFLEVAGDALTVAGVASAQPELAALGFGLRYGADIVKHVNTVVNGMTKVKATIPLIHKLQSIAEQVHFLGGGPKMVRMRMHTHIPAKILLHQVHAHPSATPGVSIQ